MRMKVPKMSWRDFLELSKGLRADPRFALTNQDVENGFVKFRNEKALTRLKDLLDYYSHGLMPISTVQKKAVAAQKLRDIGFEFEEWRKTLEEVRYKGTSNGVIWYVARCPSCEGRGDPDIKGHGVNFSETGIVNCHRGCGYYDVIGSTGESQALYAKKLREEGKVLTPTLFIALHDSEMFKYELAEKEVKE
jgi:hypothetical protein